jgi:hypothetical protein
MESKNFKSYNICIDSDNKEQIDFIIRFLSDFRRNFNDYKSDTFLKFDTISHTIHLLNNHLNLIKSKEEDLK